jgi:hypothetical protein
VSARHAIRATATAAAGLAVALPVPAVGQAAAPRVEQLVAFKDGSAKQKRVKARAAAVRVGGRRCAVGSATALAALIRSDAGSLRLKDYGACSGRAADAGGLYVAAIAGERARGQNGWVYKVGNKVGTAGAADPQGAFGRGRLRRGARITWFYCRMSVRTGSCQRTLGIGAAAQGGGVVRVTVRGYDDRGRSRLRAGATVHAGSVTATTGADGTATLQLAPGRARVWASAPGLVRSFKEAVDVR